MHAISFLTIQAYSIQPLHCQKLCFNIFRYIYVLAYTMGIFSKAVCSPQNFMLISQLSLAQTNSAQITMQGSLSTRVKNTLVNMWSYGLRRWQKILMILKCFLTFPSRALFPAIACYILLSF